MKYQALQCMLLSILAIGCFAGADWPQFRGDGSGIAQGNPPESWSTTDKVQWKTPLPGRGPASPIVVDNRVIVTCSDGVLQDKLMVLCFDAGSGKELWRRSFWATGRTATHPTSANAAPTPASDGRRIFAFYSSNDLICLDLNGNLLWFRGLAYDFPKAGNDVGMASSPVVADGVVVVQVENQGDSFAVGVDAESGQTLWRVERGKEANWSSPVALPSDDGFQILLQSPDGVTAHHPRTGEELWRYQAACQAIASPVAEKGKAYISTNDGLTLLKIPAGSGSPELVWQKQALAAGPASPVVHDGLVYSLRRGILACGDAQTGELYWKKRFTGEYWGTPVLAANKLFFGNKEGEAQVVVLNGKEEPQQVIVNPLGEEVLSTMAIVGDAIFIRTDAHLWKIAK